MTTRVVAKHVGPYPVEVDEIYGCWRWTGAKDADGYGFVWRGPTRVKAYRVVYEAEVGALPQGLVLDHLCRRRDCVNPDHLEPVTKNDNEKRKSWRHRVQRTTCRRGHDMRLTSMVTPEGGRVCRACARGAG